MGQSQSHRQGLSSSDDRISLFISCNDSITSLTSDQRYEDILTRNYQNHRNFKTCRKLSKLKKSFSECFRSKFSHLQEVEDVDVSQDSEIIGAQRPNSEMSKAVVNEGRVRRLSDSSTIVNQSLPRDIQEIHYQLTELKKLLSRPDSVYDQQIDRRDQYCQTDKIDILSDNTHPRDSMITKLQDQLNNLRVNLDSRNKMAESFAKELTILRSQQLRRTAEIEPRALDQFIGVLKSIRKNRRLENTDLDKFDDGINLMTSLSISHRIQGDKTNVAIINPCSQTISETSKEDHSYPLILPQPTEMQPVDELHNPFLPMEKSETKMVIFMGESTTPYLSTIPLSSSQITLAKVKEYTSSMLPKERNFRYFFKTISPEFGPAKEEIIRDQDIVPIIEGKIILVIQP